MHHPWKTFHFCRALNYDAVFFHWSVYCSVMWHHWHRIYVFYKTYGDFSPWHAYFARYCKWTLLAVHSVGVLFNRSTTRMVRECVYKYRILKIHSFSIFKYDVIWYCLKNGCVLKTLIGRQNYHGILLFLYIVSLYIELSFFHLFAAFCVDLMLFVL